MFESKEVDIEPSLIVEDRSEIDCISGAVSRVNENKSGEDRSFFSHKGK